MPSSSYNLARALLNRAGSGHVFVPIRSMQYLAIIDGDDFWFVDSEAYAVKNNRGGRMITVSWHLEAVQRESLQQNIPMKVVFYDRDMSGIQARLVAEFRDAMQLVDNRYRNGRIPPGGARIVRIDGARLD